MAERVYEVPSKEKAKLEQYLSTDPISRLSITLKDAKFFEEDKSAVYLFLSGDEQVMVASHPALDALGAMRVADEANRFQKLKDAEDEAAGGVGFIFG